jgi:hypothetical protein
MPKAGVHAQNGVPMDILQRETKALHAPKHAKRQQ